MRLDLRNTHPFPLDFQPVFQELTEEIKEDFNALAKDMSAQQGHSFAWQLTPPASRDVRVSPLFHHCTCLALLLHLEQENIDTREIITDSPAMAELVRRWTTQRKKNTQVTLKAPNTNTGVLSKSLRAIRQALAPLRRGLRTRKCLKNKNCETVLPDEKIVLIDTFVIPKYIDNDRFYGELHLRLPEQHASKIFFVPTFSAVSMSDIASFCDDILAAKRTFLFKEHFLSLGDYFQAWLRTLRTRFIRIPSVSFRGFDLTGLVREDLHRTDFFQATFLGFLNLIFLKRLQEQGVTIRRAINWFENQPMDKGWNLGLKLFHPQAERVGYQGFPMLINHISTFPSPCEYRTGTVPDTIAVLGKSHQRYMTRALPEVNVICAPSFRYAHTFQSHQTTTKDAPTILVALSQDQEPAKSLLDMTAKALSTIEPRVQVLVKQHPTQPVEQLTTHLAHHLPQAQIVDGPISDFYPTIDLVVVNSSTVSIEALANGVPVSMVADPCSLSMVLLPEGLPERFARTCYNATELAKQITSLLTQGPLDQADRERLSAEIISNHFTPVTDAGISKLLGLPSPGPQEAS